MPKKELGWGRVLVILSVAGVSNLALSAESGTRPASGADSAIGTKTLRLDESVNSYLSLTAGWMRAVSPKFSAPPPRFSAGSSFAPHYASSMPSIGLTLGGNIGSHLGIEYGYQMSKRSGRSLGIHLIGANLRFGDPKASFGLSYAYGIFNGKAQPDTSNYTPYGTPTPGAQGLLAGAGSFRYVQHGHLVGVFAEAAIAPHLSLGMDFRTTVWMEDDIERNAGRKFSTQGPSGQAIHMEFPYAKHYDIFRLYLKSYLFE